MKRLWLYLILIYACAGCRDEISLPKENLRRAVIVYVMGENSLSYAAQTDLNEIRSAVGQIPDSCAMAVYFDNSRTDIKPQILLFDKTHGEQTLLTYGADQTSTDSTVMLSALRFITQKVQADEYGLILWSHGSGWLPARKTIGIDNKRNNSSNSGVEMEITTLRGVLENVGVHWAYIFYDACFMQCIEVAYELRQLTDWSIGSPAEIPAFGAPYDRLMPYLFQQTGYAQSITEQYYNFYRDDTGLLLSAIRSDELESLARATVDVLSHTDELPTDGIQQYCAYSSQTGWKSEFFDMGSCMARWLNADDYKQWSQALERAVPYRYSSDTWPTSYSSVFEAKLTDAEHYTGISMYVPFPDRSQQETAWKRYQWYRDAGYRLN